MWIDQQLPEGGEPRSFANDPQRVVLNITTTGDIAAMELAVREVWGGPLCVSTAVRSEAALAPIRDALITEAGIVGLSIDHKAGQVAMEMFRGTEERQSELDAAYGEGLVRLTGRLVPID